MKMTETVIDNVQTTLCEYKGYTFFFQLETLEAGDGFKGWIQSGDKQVMTFFRRTDNPTVTPNLIEETYQNLQTYQDTNRELARSNKEMRC